MNAVNESQLVRPSGTLRDQKKDSGSGTRSRAIVDIVSKTAIASVLGALTGLAMALFSRDFGHNKHPGDWQSCRDRSNGPLPCVELFSVSPVKRRLTDFREQ
jgi:hypothetical protein